MPQRENGQGLFLENVPLHQLLQHAQTPFYATSLTAVKERVVLYKKTLHSYFKNSAIFYACKANFAQPILKEVLQAGGSIDIVSIGEWKAVIQAGFSPQNICFAGVGKKEQEWTHALSHGLGFLNCEHIQECEDVLNYIFENKNSLTSIPVISLRLNPCLEIETHPHLITGALNSKFGILFSHIQEFILKQKKNLSEEKFKQWISPLKGIHVHIGSQLTAKDIFQYTVKNVFDCAQFLFEQDVFISHLDLGGGLGVPVEGVPHDGSDIVNHVSFLCETIQTQAKEYPSLISLWKPNFSNLFVCFEPGRSIVASSTVFLTTVLYTKINSNEQNEFRFCYVDGAMNDFPRPSLYDAVHFADVVHISPENKLSHSEVFHWKIVGPVCESGDYLSKKCELPQIKKNDVIAFFEAGAYCRSMASQYNLRNLPEEVFVKENVIV